MMRNKATYEELEQRNRELENELFLYKTIIANVPISVFAKDAQDEYRYIIWNKELEKVFGTSSNQIIGTHDYQLFENREEADYFREYDISVMNGKEIIDIPNENLTTANGIKIVHTRKIPIYDENNQPKILLGCLEDITSKVLMEQTLKESEEKYRTYFNNVGEGFASVSPDEEFIYANPAAESIFGVEKNNLIGRNLKEFFSNEQFKTVNIQTGIRKQGQSSNYELELTRFDGIKRNIYITAVPQFDVNQNFIGTCGIFRDITESKNIEKALKYEQYLMNSLMDNVTANIYFKDCESRFIRINNAQAKLFGLSDPKLAIGKTDFDFFSEIHAQQALDDEKEIIRTGQIISKEERETWNDRPDTWVLTTKLPLRDNDAKIIGTFGISTSITDRKEAELIIHKQNQELKELNSDKDRFISILAHDLKTPFTAMLGFSSLLVRNIHKYDIEKIENIAKTVDLNIRRTYHLLDDILMWVLAQSGKLPFEIKEFNFSTICNEVLENLQSNALAKNITINYFGNEHILIFADINMLKTILRNLISNALKFSYNKGNIDIHAEKNIDNIIVSVSDCGIGMEPEKLNKLFDISNIHASKDTTGEKGSGLGLILCKEFVEKHGGKIWAESEVGKGSNFRFTIPVIDK